MVESHNTLQHQRTEYSMWFLIAILIGIYIILAGGLLIISYNWLTRTATERLDNLAALYDDNLTLQMSNLDSILRTTRSEVQGSDQDAINAFVVQTANRLPQLRTIVVTNEAGIITADSREGTPAIGIDVSDRDYFIVQQQAEEDYLFIDIPILSRVDSQWSLPITRAIRADDETFLGIVIASIDPLYFAGTPGNLISGHAINGYILNTDSTILSTIPYDHDYIGRTLVVDIEQSSSEISSETSLMLEPDLFIRSSTGTTTPFDVVFTQERNRVMQPFVVEIAFILTALIALIIATTLIIFYQIRYTRKIRHEAHMRLKKEQEYRTLAENVEDFIIRFDRNLRHVYVNPALASFTGLTIEDYIGKNNEELNMPPGHVAFWNQEIRRVFESGQTNVIDFEIRNDDTPSYFQAKITPEYNAAGQIMTVLSVVRNVTDLKQAEQQAVQERELLRTLIDNIPDYIVVKDKNGQYIVSNKAHTELTGNSDRQIIGHTADAIYGTDFAATYLEDDKHVLDNGQSIINVERTTKDANGNVLHLLLTKIPLRDETGQITGLVAISRDMTEWRELEQKRKDAEKTQSEIERSRQVLAMKQRFITMASHDFKTPLAIILSSVGLIELHIDRYSSDQIIQKLQRVKYQIMYMTGLMNDLLNAERIQSGIVQAQFSELDLKLFCERIWQDMVELDQSQHHTQFMYDTDYSIIEADEMLLHHVLVNLLSNAFKYTPAGENITFHVLDSGQTIRFEISDTGIGIPDEDMPQLFEPFHRADNVGNVKGTGLGLTIVKEYIELHHGNVKVTSTQDEGTTFSVTIPIQQGVREQVAGSGG